MPTVFTIGEALIDFMPHMKGCSLKEVSAFTRAAGGAPANVACSVAKLGGSAAFIGKLGKDSFGEFILETMKAQGVDTSYVSQTEQANTALAFVSLREDGNREFTFYRHPSADMLLEASEIKREWFAAGDLLHFCSVSLIDAPVCQAHEQALAYCREQGGVISFDPNIRLSLWRSERQLRETIQRFLPLADIVKISDEELAFITGIDNEEQALRSLFTGEVKHVLYTRGAAGAEWIAKDFRVYVPGLNVQAIDTTGAGDSFVGALLYQLAEQEESLEEITVSVASELLKFANTAAGLTTLRHGGIPALVDKQQVLNYWASL